MADPPSQLDSTQQRDDCETFEMEVREEITVDGDGKGEKVGGDEEQQL